MNNYTSTNPRPRDANEAVLLRFLTEFGYMHAAKGDVRVAFRMALEDRGAVRLDRELACRT